MNNQLEQDLARLGQLMTPDQSLVDRVLEQILPPAPRKPYRHWMIRAGLSVAASVLLAIGLIALSHRRAAPDRLVQKDDLQLVRTSTEWRTLSVQPVVLAGDIPGCEVCKQRFERSVWMDRQNHATFERSVPREKVTLVTLESY